MVIKSFGEKLIVFSWVRFSYIYKSGDFLFRSFEADSTCLKLLSGIGLDSLFD